MTRPTYVLITPARNEAKFIELTIKSVVGQTVKPVKWVIVSDGSTDATDEIVSRYAAEYPWIELIRMPERRERDFAGKVRAFNAGYAKVKGLQFDAVGSLDGDLSFDEEYFAFLLQKLAEDPELGLVGTPFQEGSGEMYNYRFSSVQNVSGACQLFRRQSFEQIGGYVPLKDGGIDHVAQITVRMKGWKTRTFTERVLRHHRKMGTGRHGNLTVCFRQGVKDYMFGNHPAWEIFRTMYQMTKKPFALGGLLLAAGYWSSLLSGRHTPISSDIRAFVRREQMRRLKALFAGPLASAKSESNRSLSRT